MPKNPMEAVHAARRANLRLLIAKYDGQQLLARKLAYNKSYISQLVSGTKPYAISEKAARKIEEKLGLQSGWLDIARVSA